MGALRSAAVVGVVAIAVGACSGGAAKSPPASASTTSATSGGAQQFELPSGNVGCYIDATGVRCDIRDRSWQPPAKPASCDVDFGQGIELRDREAAFVCAGDTTLGGGSTLAYGMSIERGPFRCDSSAEGVECKNSRTGHAFHLSRASYRIS